MLEIPGSLNFACTRRQAEDALGDRRVRAALRNGLLKQPWRGVVVPAEREFDITTRSSAAWLAVGVDSVVSGTSAAAMHGCDAVTSPDVHLTVPSHRALHRRPGLTIRRGGLTKRDIVELAGLPVLALDAAVAEILCTRDRRDALAIADQALALFTGKKRERFRKKVIQRLDERSDRHGVMQAFSLLNLATGKAESPRESWLLLLIVDARFPVPVAQFSVRDLDGRELWRPDLSWPELRILIEYDGYAAHCARSAEDARRDEDLRRRGWIVIRATADDFRDSTRLIIELRRAFAQRGIAV